MISTFIPVDEVLEVKRYVPHLQVAAVAQVVRDISGNGLRPTFRGDHSAAQTYSATAAFLRSERCDPG